MKRSESLDALRGLAILLMVLSSSIAFGILPGWMYHAQVPPPAHAFMPDKAGITWVDLVFPFFLFSMGTALPIALSKKLDTLPVYKVLVSIVKRYVLLVFFSFFTFYARAWVMEALPGTFEYFLSILAFGLLFLMFADVPLSYLKKTWVRVCSFLLALVFLFIYPFSKGFSFSSTDIIILVLANMALFGSVIWCLTRNNPLVRLGLLPFIMAVFLASKQEGSINEFIFNLSPATVFYRFYFLKYLFIVIPGTLAGDWLMAQSKEPEDKVCKRNTLLLILLPWALLIVNLWGLYSRSLEINMMLSGILGILTLVIATRAGGSLFVSRMMGAGVYLLILGLFFEAYEGGIKKDISTYSYYFVCTGLAFLVLCSLFLIEKLGYTRPVLAFLSDTGKNPMIAYTAGNLFLIPLLKITGLETWLNLMNNSLWGGFLRGLIFTAIVGFLTIFFTRKKIFWRT